MSTKRLIMILIAAGMLGTAAGFMILRKSGGAPRSVPILMYHSVGPTNDSPWFVPAEAFRAHMGDLRREGFKAILPSDLVAHSKWGKPLPRKPVIVTFDDGYLCNLSVIEPILKEHGMRAVIYLITGSVGASPGERRAYEGKDCLVWPEILAMQERGTFAFGGHSHSHFNQAASGDPLPDIAECLRQLQAHGVRWPYAFCYPFGQYKPETVKAVRAAGFRTAVVCEDAVAVIGPGRDLFTLPRVSVMGGRHEFKLAAADVDRQRNTLALRVAHEGVPMEISACLAGREKSWLPAREIGRGEFTLVFTLAGRGTEGLTHLEIWDKHRLFRLSTLKPAER